VGENGSKAVDRGAEIDSRYCHSPDPDSFLHGDCKCRESWSVFVDRGPPDLHCFTRFSLARVNFVGDSWELKFVQTSVASLNLMLVCFVPFCATTRWTENIAGESIAISESLEQARIVAADSFRDGSLHIDSYRLVLERLFRAADHNSRLAQAVYERYGTRRTRDSRTNLWNSIHSLELSLTAIPQAAPSGLIRDNLILALVGAVEATHRAKRSLETRKRR
jgi:hypothetical protein